MAERLTRTREEWAALAREHYGENPALWQFRCVGCGEVQTVHDFLEAGLPPDAAAARVYFSCIGRVVDGRGCDWSLGGLFRTHTREVIDLNGRPAPVFEFAFESQEPAHA